MTVDTDSSGVDNLDTEMLKALVAEASQVNLEALSPEKGLEMYLSLREDEVAASTLDSHRSRLQFFLEWCDENEIDNLNDLSGRDVQAFRQWRKEDLAVSSLETNMRTLRIFLQKCVKFDAVNPGLPDKVEVPSISAAKNSREDLVTADEADAILTHLDKYEYGTIEHVAWLLMASAGLRLCALRALDVEDYTSTTNGGLLELNHRPESGTRLKNQDDSERVISISEYVSEVIEDYLADQRPNVTDDYGRRPLLATSQGRIVTTTLRKYAYKWTRPCVTGPSCPHGKVGDEIAECDANQTASAAYRCPSSSSPHTVRRGYITHELDTGVPKQVVADRCDVTPEVIDDHYDERSEQEKMELRKEVRDSVYGDDDSAQYGQETSNSMGD